MVFLYWISSPRGPHQYCIKHLPIVRSRSSQTSRDLTIRCLMPYQNDPQTLTQLLSRVDIQLLPIRWVIAVQVSQLGTNTLRYLAMYFNSISVKPFDGRCNTAKNLNKLQITMVTRIYHHQLFCNALYTYRPVQYTHTDQTTRMIYSGRMLGSCPANERRGYKLTPSLIGWAQT